MNTTMPPCGALCLLLLCLPMSVGAADLYVTDFSEFSVGADQLAGNDGWSASHNGEGLHGIDEAIYSGRGRSAFLGGSPRRDGADHVLVHHAFDPAPAGASVQTIRFDVVFGVSASLEGGEDSFGFGFYDEDGKFLASLDFDTSEFDFGIWADDGGEVTHTGETFLTDYLHVLSVAIDPRANQWAANLDGIAIFDSRPFTTVTDAPVVGGVAAEWHIADAGDPGDNWLLFDDWSVAATLDQVSIAPPEVTGVERQLDGTMEIRWAHTTGLEYRVQTSPDGLVWVDVGIAAAVEDDSPTVVYRDVGTSGMMRLYRVQAFAREETP